MDGLTFDCSTLKWGARCLTRAGEEVQFRGVDPLRRGYLFANRQGEMQVHLQGGRLFMAAEPHARDVVQPQVDGPTLRSKLTRLFRPTPGRGGKPGAPEPTSETVDRQGATPARPLVERVARALCEAEHGKPDALEPIEVVTRDMPPPDAFDEDGRGCHFYWRRYIGKARAALDACRAEEMQQALVLAAIPLEAMILGGTVDLHTPKLRDSVYDAVAAIRTSLPDEQDGKPSGGAV